MPELLFSRKPEERLNDMERMIRQFDTDIKRLWRHVKNQPLWGNGVAGDGEINPSSSETTSSATSIDTGDSGSSIPGDPPGYSSSESGHSLDSSASDNEGSGSGGTGVTGSCCVWMWTGSSWILVEDYTGTTCTCEPPSHTGSFVFELYRWCCGDDEFDSDSSETSSTSSCGHCIWQWDADNDEWEFVSTSCAAGCECVYPTSVVGAFDGQQVETDCIPEESSGCGTCTFTWSESTQTWLETSGNCTFGGFCNTPDFEGSFDGQTYETFCFCTRDPDITS